MLKRKKWIDKKIEEYRAESELNKEWFKSLIRKSLKQDDMFKGNQ